MNGYIIITKSGVSVLAPCCYDGTTTAGIFETWFEHFLLPELEAGSVIIMDSVISPQSCAFEIAKAHGISLLFLPPYSPDFNPIEKLWANMKRHLRNSIASFDSLENAVYDYLSG